MNGPNTLHLLGTHFFINYTFFNLNWMIKIYIISILSRFGYFIKDYICKSLSKSEVFLLDESSNVQNLNIIDFFYLMAEKGS